ncbi:MAG: hypothetical protein ACT4OP_07000 [Actinomycetota bacterium]
MDQGDPANWRLDDFTPLDLVSRRLAPWYRVRVVVVAGGTERVIDQGEWDDTLLVVERGEIELECRSGSRRRFSVGSTLWLVGLRLRAMVNPHAVPAHLIAVSRNRDDWSSADHP